MKKIRIIASVLMALLLLIACPIDQIENEPAQNSEKEITAFSFMAADNTELSSDVTGIISGTDIDLTVPYGTDVTALVASFATTGASVTVDGTEQTSGTTANDFSNPLTYRVTAADNTWQDYTVTAAIAAAATEGSGFSSAIAAGDTGEITFSPSSETLTMIYANDSTNITFPIFEDDSANVTLTKRFWMAETEVTNAVMAAVLQWAYDNGWFSTTVGDHNGLDATTAKQGEQQLLNLGDENCRVDYDGSGSFTAESGYDDHPVTNITWYGAVMFCNWLTEMRDGTIDNVVYTDIDTDWEDHETTENIERNGYRLPSKDEWEYAARYLGTTEPETGGNLDSERKYGNDDPDWTDGYYWTPGNYASAAYTYWDDESDVNPANSVVDNKDANDLVAVYGYYYYDGTWQDKGTSDEAAVKSLGEDSANALGLYDMSGNVFEWCFSVAAGGWVARGGGWNGPSLSLQVGLSGRGAPAYFEGNNGGFRICRTAD